jgi:hypothetical protein
VVHQNFAEGVNELPNYVVRSAAEPEVVDELLEL